MSEGVKAHLGSRFGLLHWGRKHLSSSGLGFIKERAAKKPPTKSMVQNGARFSFPNSCSRSSSFSRELEDSIAAKSPEAYFTYRAPRTTCTSDSQAIVA
jgi:hypothetical protein